MSATETMPAGAASERSVRLQSLIDQVAGFNAFAVPEPGSVRTSRAAGGALAGGRLRQTLHRFEVDLEPPSPDSGVRASNVFGEAIGGIDLDWRVIPRDFLARPDLEPPATPLDAERSQRFVLQEARFSFGDGRDGFRSFGTGRTFPVSGGGDRPRLVAGAVGNLTEGFGKFQGHEGSFTFCGELDPERGLTGHLLVRVLDSDGSLRTTANLPSPSPVASLDRGATYLVFGAQKGTGGAQQNRWSLAPDGQIRGANIPTRLKLLRLRFAADGPEGFRAASFETGSEIGQEVGFGREPEPGGGPGTALRPSLFEGVARYTFEDASGRELGAITTNVLEGRRFDVRLPEAPEEPAFRFGFFGPIVLGTGCFRGAQGFFYGASGSILRPPPAEHVITHFYAARLDDPDGRFRAAVERGDGR
jgi:hypothetical protein